MRRHGHVRDGHAQRDCHRQGSLHGRGRQQAGAQDPRLLRAVGPARGRAVVRHRVGHGLHRGAPAQIQHGPEVGEVEEGSPEPGQDYSCAVEGMCC